MDEFMIICYESCWMMLIMSIHGLGVDDLNCCCWFCCLWKRWYVVVEILVFWEKLFSIVFISHSSAGKSASLMCLSLGLSLWSFRMNGGLKQVFWGENLAKTRGRNTPGGAFSRHCAWRRALGAHFQEVIAGRCTLGALDRTAPWVVVCLGALVSACRGPMCSFFSTLLLFSIINLL